MKVIKFVDIVATAFDEEGEPYDIIHAKDVCIPSHINELRISEINPYFTKTGRLFKNVSLITYEGLQMKVLGNYNDLNSRLEDKPQPINGYYGKR